MNIFVIATFLSFMCLIETTAAIDWAKWKKKHNKTYTDKSRNNVRQTIFQNNINKIDEHNAKNLSFKMDTNNFSDLSDDEIAARYTMYIDEESVKTLIKQAKVAKFRKTNTGRQLIDVITNVTQYQRGLNVSVNWVTAGFVAPVRDQGGCGSCYAFATVSTSNI